LKENNEEVFEGPKEIVFTYKKKTTVIDYKEEQVRL